MLSLCRTQVELKLKPVFSFEIGAPTIQLPREKVCLGPLLLKGSGGADSLQSQTVYRGIYHIPFVLSPLEPLLAPALDGCAGSFLPY